ncbi:DUF3899 domain-containing protein [Brochothrix campestris]|uniref:DUF3899 domain-containing protein n=1 Tax=Brochothrix campestris FSL F6-1037 TaxID=1265861 RepID=W7CP24_9LIST|nr:DUF3899 domain-containing protein [Brochothrix campestris]EUJ41334.1 hypothetical protein BCAMP_03460 [Brochothrix campestris FSL F6-1037]
MKKSGFYLGLSLLVVVLIVTFKQPGWTVENFMNVSFLVGIIFLLLGLLLMVVRGGFFDIFHSSMRLFFNFGPNKRSQEDIQEAGMLSELITLTYAHFLLVGCVYLGVNLLLLFIFY